MSNLMSWIVKKIKPVQMNNHARGGIQVGAIHGKVTIINVTLGNGGDCSFILKGQTVLQRTGNPKVGANCPRALE